MKVIFLDVDGVLNTRADWKQMYTLNDRCILEFIRYASRMRACELKLYQRQSPSLLQKMHLKEFNPYVPARLLPDNIKEYYDRLKECPANYETIKTTDLFSN